MPRKGKRKRINYSVRESGKGKGDRIGVREGVYKQSSQLMMLTQMDLVLFLWAKLMVH